MPQSPLNRETPHALVAGATGLIGRRIAERLHSQGWRVTGLCRRPPDTPAAYPLIRADLTDAGHCRRALSSLGPVTHLFYAARYDHPEGSPESVDVNSGMLENLLAALDCDDSRLKHVHLVHGTKYYGHMLGPLTLPLTEESPRARVPNFYFTQEDRLRQRQSGKRWSYSTSRPHTFCDESTGEPRNAALLIAVYASLSSALDLPLAYPGTEKSFGARTQFTYVPMLARAVEWMATTEACENASYNVVNGDAPRWSELWPLFADYFGVECGAASSFSLAEWAADKDAAWQALVDRFGLSPGPLLGRVLWPYADYLFAPEWDIISSMSKARRDGFGEQVDTGRMFIDLFERLRGQKIIP